MGFAGEWWAAAALVAVLAAGVVSGDGARVGRVVPGAGTPIQTPIDDAGAGDTIYVHAGAYCENVDVDKRITLIGEGADITGCHRLSKTIIVR
ncbi:hypothetical protein DRN77_07445 [Methanosarcinales archaeon]|nr:MAG: hypothetical protein DRN77_07445 [Methanosarcinales archaeon]